jgi:bifunctional UDP-N-acetylglucosamine pyrophosphorylase/glucosamine-1-phosphate N-acetyltransferase
MDFVCLAAGHGTRLGRLGRYLQKCMYPVGLKPFLEHSLEQLIASRSGAVAGDRLALVVGHHAQQVRSYFGQEFEGLEIVYVDQEERLGTGHALTLAYQQLEPRSGMVGWQADLFVTQSMFEAVIAHPAATVVTLGPGAAGEAPVLRATVVGERVTRVWDGVGPLYDVGLWKLSSAVLAEIGALRAPTGEVRMLMNMQRSIDKGAYVGYVECSDWIHLGGTLPTAEENVDAVVAKVLAIGRRQTRLERA